MRKALLFLFRREFAPALFSVRTSDCGASGGIKVSLTQQSAGLGWLSSYQSELLNPPVPRLLSPGYSVVASELSALLGLVDCCVGALGFVMHLLLPSNVLDVARPLARP